MEFLWELIHHPLKLHVSRLRLLTVSTLYYVQAEDQTAILGNSHGSVRYVEFLQRLGQLIHLRDTRRDQTFVGGLDTHNGEDGEFAYIWHDDVMQSEYLLEFSLALRVLSSHWPSVCVTLVLRVYDVRVSTVFSLVFHLYGVIQMRHGDIFASLRPNRKRFTRRSLAPELNKPVWRFIRIFNNAH